MFKFRALALSGALMATVAAIQPCAAAPAVVQHIPLHDGGWVTLPSAQDQMALSLMTLANAPISRAAETEL